MTLVFGTSKFRKKSNKISNKVRYSSFFRNFWRHTQITSKFCCVLVCQFTVSFPPSELCYKCFSYNDIFHDLRITFLCGMLHYVWNNIWKLRFIFVLDCDIFFISSQYVIYLFDVVTFSDDVRIMLHFGTFELHMTMTWKLCFIFVHHCDTFFRTLQLRYLFVQCS